MTNFNMCEVFRWLLSRPELLHPEICAVTNVLSPGASRDEMLIFAATRAAEELAGHEGRLNRSPPADAHIHWAQVAAIQAARAVEVARADGLWVRLASDLVKNDQASFAEALIMVDDDDLGDRLAPLLDEAQERCCMTSVAYDFLTICVRYARESLPRTVAIYEPRVTGGLVEAKPAWHAAVVIAVLKGLVVRTGILSIDDRIALVEAASETSAEADPSEIRKFVRRIFEPRTSFDDLHPASVNATRHPGLQSALARMMDINAKRRCFDKLQPAGE